MARQEVSVAQLSAQSFDQGDEVMGNVRNCSLHPHGNGGAAELVQAKSFINSMLQLIQRVWGRGEGSVLLLGFMVPMRAEGSVESPHEHSPAPQTDIRRRKPPKTQFRAPVRTARGSGAGL